MSTDPKPEIYLNIDRWVQGRRIRVHRRRNLTNLVTEDLREHDLLHMPRNYFICNQPEHDPTDPICQSCRPHFGNPSAEWDGDEVRTPKGWIGKIPVQIECGQKGRNLDSQFELNLRPSNASMEAAKQMVEDVETFLRGLAQDLYAPVYVYSYLDREEYQSTLHNRLQLMLKVVDRLIPLIHRLSPMTYNRIKTTEQVRRIESLRQFDGRIVERLIQQPLVAGALVSEQHISARQATSRTHLQLPVSESSPDIYEHRFIRSFIERICAELRNRIYALQRSRSAVEKDIQNARAKNWNDEQDLCTQKYERHLRWIHKTEKALFQLQRTIKTTFLDQIPPLNGEPQITHLLRRNPIYRKIYELYIWLFQDLKIELDPVFEEELFRQSLEKTWQIYEYWGLVCTVRALRNQLDFEWTDKDTLLKRMETRLYVQIDSGTQFAFTKGNLQIRLHFSYDHRKHTNPYFRFRWLTEPNRYSKSHHSTPDLHLCFLKNGEYLGSLILDTKWKPLVQCQFGTESYGQIEYYQEAISAVGSAKPIWAYILFAGEKDDRTEVNYDGKSLGNIRLSPDEKEKSMERLSHLIQDFLTLSWDTST